MIGIDIRRNSPTLGEEEAAAAARAIRSNWVARGPESTAFENELCELHGLSAGHAVAVSSGTAALFLSLWALGAERKRVALPAYSCQSLMHAVNAARAEPVVIDSRSAEDPNAALETIAESADITIAAHALGVPQEVVANGKPVIEDCAQALGGFFDGRRAGLQGTAAVFSFGPTKIVTAAGAGGAVMSKDAGLIDAIRDYLNYYDRDDSHARFNFEFTDVQAAVGRVQLRRLGEFCARREELFALYRSCGVDLFDAVDPRSKPVRVAAVTLAADAGAACARLMENGVPARPVIEPRHLLGTAHENASAFAARAVSLPIYPLLRDEECRYVAEIVQRLKA